MVQHRSIACFFRLFSRGLSCMAHTALSSPAWHRNQRAARQRARSAAQVVGAKERRLLSAVSSRELRDEARFTMVLQELWLVVALSRGILYMQEGHTPSTSKSTCWELFDKRQSGTAEDSFWTDSRHDVDVQGVRTLDFRGEGELLQLWQVQTLFN